MRTCAQLTTAASHAAATRAQEDDEVKFSVCKNQNESARLTLPSVRVVAPCEAVKQPESDRG